MPEQTRTYPKVTRRRFLLAMASSTAMLGFGLGAASNADCQNYEGEMPYRILGRTGEKVSLVGLGGYHIGIQPSESESIAIIRTAIDNGINFMDNSWDYNNGRSEERMGKALEGGYRDKVFLMTKVDGRDKQTAARQLDQSLKRLRTDRLDLWQFHEIIRMSDPERIFAPGGAIEAALAARQAGKIRYIGFTGHKSPRIHLKMLQAAREQDFSFDTVMFPLNVMDAHYESFQKRVLPVALDQGLGVLSMKPLGGHYILKSHTVGAVECLHYAMNQPTSVVITGCDSSQVLNQALKAARTFKPLTQQQVQDILSQTANAANGGRYELYKRTDKFDSTAHHPQWLG